MLVRFSEDFLKYTNGLPDIEVACAEVGEGLGRVFELFPQLYVHLVDNQGEVLQSTALCLDGEFIEDSSVVFNKTTDTTVLGLHRIIPCGADSDTLSFFIDPLSARLINNEQVFGKMGYGWTMPGANRIMSQQDADRLAGYAMQTVGYVMQVVGAVLLYGFGWTGWGLAGVGFMALGSMFVMMGNWSLDAAGNVAMAAPNTGLNNSAVYTFSGIRNTTASGTPFQIVYGTHRVGGHVLNMYTELENYTRFLTADTTVPTNITGNVLFAQLGLCEGEIAGVSEVEVNKLPLSYYNEVTTAPNPDFVRMGTRDQTVMPAFSRIENTTSIGRLVRNINSPPTPPTRLTTSTEPVYGYVDNVTRWGWVGPYVWTVLDPVA